jgi:putative membrane protein
MAESAVDPGRAAVERADAVVREVQEPAMDDPTVFVKGAALGALTVIELAKLAETKSENAQIRSFAMRSRKNQQAFRAELLAVAAKQRLDVPASLIYQDEQMLDEGREATGLEFDTWYAEKVFAEHLKAITLFEAAANMKNEPLAALAKKTYPMLEADLKGASDLSRR